MSELVGLNNMIIIQEKLKNFPTVHVPNLHEFPERREFIERQINAYDIPRLKMYQTVRYDRLRDIYKLHCFVDPEVHGHPGNIVSYLSMIKNWYVSSKEEYAIFMDDDINLSSIENWNFTWEEFLQHLPQDWQCIQLIRIQEWNSENSYTCGLSSYENEPPSLGIRKRRYADWGTCMLVNKSYAKSLLERYYISDVEYNLEILAPEYGPEFKMYPLIENILYHGFSGTYNFPLFFEETSLTSFQRTHYDMTDEQWNSSRFPHEKSRREYEKLWKENSSTIEQMMKLD